MAKLNFSDLIKSQDNLKTQIRTLTSIQEQILKTDDTKMQADIAKQLAELNAQLVVEQESRKKALEKTAKAVNKTADIVSHVGDELVRAKNSKTGDKPKEKSKRQVDDELLAELQKISASELDKSNETKLALSFENSQEKATAALSGVMEQSLAKIQSSYEGSLTSDQLEMLANRTQVVANELIKSNSQTADLRKLSDENIKQTTHARHMAKQADLSTRNDLELKHVLEKGTEEQKTAAKAAWAQQQLLLAKETFDPEYFEKHKEYIQESIDNEAAKLEESTKENEKFMSRMGNNIKYKVDEMANAVTKHMPIAGRVFGQSMIEHYKSGLSDAWDGLKGHMDTVLAPLNMLTGPIKGIVKFMFIMGKTLFSGPSRIEKRQAQDIHEMNMGMKTQTREQKRQAKLLAKQREKDKALGAGEAGSGSWIDKIKDMLKGGLMTIIAVVGLGVGALVSKIMLPFQVMWSVITGMSSLGAVVGKVGVLFGKIADVFKIIGVWLKTLPTLGKYFKVFFKAFNFGFKWLIWPLQIILSVMDFIKGFASTEGDIVDKIFGGLKQVIVGFIEMPVRVFSWLFEKVMGFFGVEIKGTADKIMAGIHWVLDAILNAYKFVVNMFLAPFKLAYKLVKGLVTQVFDTFAGIFGAFSKIFSGDVVEGLKDLIVNFNPISIIFGFISKIFDVLVDFFDLGDAVAKVKAWALDKVPGPLKWMFGSSEEDESDAKLNVAHAESEVSEARSEVFDAKVDRGQHLRDMGLRRRGTIGLDDQGGQYVVGDSRGKAAEEAAIKAKGYRLATAEERANILAKDEEEYWEKNKAVMDAKSNLLDKEVDLEVAEEELVDAKKENAKTLLNKLDETILSFFGIGEQAQEGDLTNNTDMLTNMDNFYKFDKAPETVDVLPKRATPKNLASSQDSSASFIDNMMIDANREWFNNASDKQRIKAANMIKKIPEEKRSRVQKEAWADLQDYASPDIGKAVSTGVMANPDIAKAGAMATQAKGNEDMVNTMKGVSNEINNTNKNFVEQSSANLAPAQGASSTPTEGRADIPTDIENLGILFYNKTWGMG